MNIQTIEDVSDCVPLYLPQSLHLKPIARINMSVALPSKITGKSISNYDIMERMRNIILPDRFSVLRVSKSTIEFIRFEAELESRSKLRVIIEKLDGRPIKLPGFSESVRIKAAEAKDDFPTRHDWDSFFRDAANMDELKAGERPDTIHFINLPIKWFAPRHHENEENVKPSESIFKRIFEKFGAVAHVDIPICDPYRNKMKAHISGMQTYSYEQDVFFEGYIQFGEYIGFVKCMDEFRGMRLVRKEGDKNSVVNIKVNFDKTKHLSDNSIKRRKAVRERLMAKDREREEEEMKKQLVEAEKLEKERRRDEMKRLADLEKQQTREAKRKEKHLKKLREREVTDISSKIKAEEIKLLETQRKLESVRLLEGVFDRISLKKKHKEIFNKGGTSASTLEFDLRNSATATSKEERHSITNKYKEAAEEELHKIRVRVNKARDDNLLKNFLGQNRSRSSSMVSISSNDSILSESNKRKKKKRKKDDSASSDDEKETSKFPGMYPGMMPMPDGMDWSAWMPYMMSMGGYFPSMGYRPYRGRGRGRGGYRGRGRGGYYGGDYDNHGHDDRYSRSYSRSRSRSRGRYRRKRRSRSRSRSTRRSDSRSRSRSRRHSRSRSRSKSQTRNRKLVSTRRSRNSWSSRSRSPDYKRRGDRKRRSTWSREGSPQKKANASPENSHTPTQKVTLQPEKLLKTAKEIQRSVQQKLKERLDEEESMRKSIMEHEEIEKRAAELTKNRSPSADSSKFISPKRAAKSQTPDKLYSD